INTIYGRVDWDWFRKGGENVLYWHYSPDKQWAMNVKIQGWNECLITYILAAASPTHPIPKAVYDAGWARGGAMKNGGTFYGNVLPLGENTGGRLFFEHYTFMGVN
ncbi:glucoamylase family protein, partial [Morganella morganii]|uniref:glucoamylase family protein n=1 Tax=Morganella morganii TaxID=582 RepID=UPI001C37DF7B